MKKQLFIFVLLSCAVLVSGRMEARTFTEDVAKMIRESSVAMLDRAASEKQLQDALVRLLDAAILTMPPSANTAGSIPSLEAAKAEFINHSMLSETGYRHLSQAYRAMNAGKDFQFPPIRTVEEVRKHIQNLINTSIGSLNNGQSELSSRLLLESVIMVVTPVSR